MQVSIFFRVNVSSLPVKDDPEVDVFVLKTVMKLPKTRNKGKTTSTTESSQEFTDLNRGSRMNWRFLR
jgi:hypothetical protein